MPPAACGAGCPSPISKWYHINGRIVKCGTRRQQLAIGDAAFWVSSGGADGLRFSPEAIGGATGRTLLLADDPDPMFARAVKAGATPASEMADEHGWRLGRILDPFGHEWEIGRPLGQWPPA